MFQCSGKKGLTLVEMLIALGIVSVLSVILLPRYASINNNLALSRNAYQLSQNIRKAREMAVSARAVGGSVPPGYGVYLIEGGTEYVIYADTNGNRVFDVSGDVIIEEINLDRKINIKDIAGVSSPLSINFVGPDPLVYITGGATAASIILGLTESSEIETINVNKVGLVYVE